MKYDVFVVGKGLAGSIIANDLIDAGKKIKVFSNSKQPSSTLVAGGMFNPVTGKYLGETWMLETLFPYLFEYYRKLEKEFESNFFHQIGLFRIFSNEENKQNLIKQIDKHRLHDYLEVVEDPSQYRGHFNAELGGIFTEKAGWIDLPLMLLKIEEKIKSHGALDDCDFLFENLEIHHDNVMYNGEKAEKVIFCEGYYAQNNPLFKWLPFNPVKGETILGTIENFDIKSIVNHGKWVMPLGNNKVRIGATYHWHEMDFENTSDAKDELLAMVKKSLKSAVNITGQQAGIRPATRDRRPFLGKHPKFENVFIFNGLGTKGVSLAPYFANELINFIYSGKDINPEVNIERFYTLYS